MTTDRFGLPLGTASAEAATAFNEALDLMLATWPGALPAARRALAADPSSPFINLLHARLLQLGADAPGFRAALAQAMALPGVDDRARSQAHIFTLLAEGRTRDALAAVRAHVAQWPRDALVATIGANQTGVIAMSGLPDRVPMLAEYLRGLAPHHDGEWWFQAHYGMALSEAGDQEAAWPQLQASRAARPNSGVLAHSIAHFQYENGLHDDALAYLRSFLAEYPRQGGIHGHLSWHLALVLLQQGRVEEAFALFEQGFAAEEYFGAAMVKVFDACAFLWRAELAGLPRDAARWQRVHEFCHRSFPKPGTPYVDWHIALADAVQGDPAPWIGALESVGTEPRYVAGAGVAQAARGFAAYERGDNAGAIALLAPLLAENTRFGGSRAQLDLFEFTLLRAYLAEGRLDAARALVAQRRPGPRGIPVAGAEALAA